MAYEKLKTFLCIIILQLICSKKIENNLRNWEQNVVEFLSKQKYVKFAYLFGSVVKGRDGSLSDIDIAVFIDESISKNKWFKLQLKLISELTNIIKIDRIDLIIMNDAPLSLNYEIIKANHSLFVRDKMDKIDFEHKIISRYLDRRYYENRWTDEFLKKVAKREI
ncbi:MAG: nucleotidyltransferase domain-containing protein [Methanosarcinales archaeon]|jgi:predicted nucleotidyltransferase|nr:nucleotidyltransferase domain-containing protein [Methanosarcinales archaeon]